MTALEMARLGRRVLLLDRARFPRWKVCGATLSPGVVDIFAEAGLGPFLQSLGPDSLETLRLGGWTKRVDLPLRGSMALSRKRLDSALIQEAIRRGCCMVEGARVRLGSLLDDRRTLEVSMSGVGTQEVHGRIVIASDGLSSGLMGQAGEPSSVCPVAKRRLVGIGSLLSYSGKGFEAGVIHMAVGDGGYVGAVRDEDGFLNVAAAVERERLRTAGGPGALILELLRDAGWPAGEEFAHAEWKGTPELTRRPSRPGSDRLFAVGDASGYVEPFTGEGMLWAFAGARALAPLAARASDSWDPRLLDEWGRVHGGLVGRAQRLCRAITWTLARPGFSKTLLRGLHLHPGLAGPVVRRVGSPLFHSA
jgi:flavin-dependent dehydrogenase